MLTLFAIIIILTSVVLGFFILIQNPKGGGLSGSFGSMGAQVMGVQKSTDAMEKGTWASIIIIALLCIASVAFYPKVENQDVLPQAPAQSSQPISPQGQ